MDKISVIIPCHNNAGALRRVYTDVLREVKKLPVSYELLYIDNASRDGSSAILRLLSQQDYACHYVSLNHRVTPVSAIFLGAQLSNGDFLCSPTPVIPPISYRSCTEPSVAGRNAAAATSLPVTDICESSPFLSFCAGNVSVRLYRLRISLHFAKYCCRMIPGLYGFLIRSWSAV